MSREDPRSFAERAVVTPERRLQGARLHRDLGVRCADVPAFTEWFAAYQAAPVRADHGRLIVPPRMVEFCADAARPWCLEQDRLRHSAAMDPDAESA